MKANVDLQPYNSFGFKAKARDLTEINDERDLQNLIRRGQLKDQNILVIGGGNNILLTQDVFDGIVIVMRNKGIKRIYDEGNNVIYRIQAGEDWPEYVKLMVSKGLYGVENLAGIPGTIGAAPVQNIGAYGMELKDSFVQCEAIQLATGKRRIFDNKECVFGYRSSIFKTMLRGQYVITSVDIKLSKQAELNLDYGNIRSFLEENKIAKPSLQDVHDAICSIRDTKLPNPKILGNSGSFFKNPVIDEAQYEELTRDYPDMPHYDEPNGKVKIPAAWLIEHTGWKGRREGNVGVYEKQPLILVHFGNGKGSDITSLAQEIQNSVSDKFGIKLLPEVNYI